VNLFFDTSALVKYFHPEVGTSEVIELIENPVHQISVSDLARIEFISALYRKLRRGDINNVQLQETLSDFDVEWLQFNRQPLSGAAVACVKKPNNMGCGHWTLYNLPVLSFWLKKIGHSSLQMAYLQIRSYQKILWSSGLHYHDRLHLYLYAW
jgi:uncharacterized protein with PIN domain